MTNTFDFCFEIDREKSKTAAMLLSLTILKPKYGRIVVNVFNHLKEDVMKVFIVG